MNIFGSGMGFFRFWLSFRSSPGYFECLAGPFRFHWFSGFRSDFRVFGRVFGLLFWFLKLSVGFLAGCLGFSLVFWVLAVFVWLFGWVSWVSNVSWVLRLLEIYVSHVGLSLSIYLIYGLR